MRSHTARSYGFTLIELTVVIAIIGLLSSIILVSMSSFRAKGRDGQRLTDMREIQLALKTYYADTGHYLYTTGWTGFDGVYATNHVYADAAHTSDLGTLSQALASYLQAVHDPKLTSASDSGYLYINQQSAGSYCVLFWRTPEDLNDFPSTMVPKTRCQGWSSSGVCNVAGTSGSATNAIFSGEGAYATNGC